MASWAGSRPIEQPVPVLMNGAAARRSLINGRYPAQFPSIDLAVGGPGYSVGREAIRLCWAGYIRYTVRRVGTMFSISEGMRWLPTRDRYHLFKCDRDYHWQIDIR